MSITKMMFGGFRYGAPTALAVAGSLEASGEKVAIIAYEWPQSFAPVASQADLENLHIRRFEADLQFHGIPVPYEDLQRGADPPDFWISLNSKRVVSTYHRSFLPNVRQRQTSLRMSVQR
jgi:hypothetical protein